MAPEKVRPPEAPLTACIASSAKILLKEYLQCKPKQGRAPSKGRLGGLRIIEVFVCQHLKFIALAFEYVLYCCLHLYAQLQLPRSFRRVLENPPVVQVSVLIVGAGPTGLGAATRIQQHGLTDWLIIDQARFFADVRLCPLGLEHHDRIRFCYQHTCSNSDACTDNGRLCLVHHPYPEKRSWVRPSLLPRRVQSSTAYCKVTWKPSSSGLACIHQHIPQYLGP